MIYSISRSVWSFWNKPFEAHKNSIWFSEKHHLLSWILSLETARKHYSETVLVTDDEGAQMLVDGIGLEFDSVSTELNSLQKHNPDWWMLGKLYAYKLQNKPFIHLDADVFFWEGLPKDIASAPVFAQNPETFIFGNGSKDCCWYRPEVYTETIRATNGWLPKEWDWYVSHQGNRAYCCGFLGGNQVAFINHYANTAIKIIEHPKNQSALALLANKSEDAMLLEQYVLSACIEYHKYLADSPFQGIDICCLFNSMEDAARNANKHGYTHLLGDAKKNKQIIQRLEKRVAEDYPIHYERCLRYLNNINVAEKVTSKIQKNQLN
ncbi:MAG: DUF6734 family protein [Xenococcus sp. (in: cyanobacteria)]